MRARPMRPRPAPRLSPSAGAGLALLVALAAAATAAATCVLPLTLLGAPTNLTLGAVGVGPDELTNYLVVLRRDAPADAVDALVADVAARQGSVVTAPAVADGNATNTSKGTFNTTGVFAAVVYRALRGPAVRGLAACLSPAAAAYLSAHPLVLAVVEDPFISLQQHLPPPSRIELRGHYYGGGRMWEARDDVDVRRHPPTGAWRVLPPVAGGPLAPPPRDGRHRRPPSQRHPSRDNTVDEGGGGDVVDLAGRYAFHSRRTAARHGRAPRQLQHPSGSASATHTQKDAPWHLGRINNRADRKGEYDYSQTGAGVDVYVLDSGVNAGHQEFTGRIQAGANFSPDQDASDTSDCNGHGTHVTGLAAGTTFGAAKDAAIIPVRVYDCSSEGPLSQGLDGINWVLGRMRANPGKRAVINMSFGSTRSAYLDSAVADLVAAGGVVVVAAGNEKSNACLESPSGSPSALAVAASKKNDDFATGFSNYGPCVGMIAPGVDVKSAWIGSAKATKTLSGTSSASPITAGVAALVLEANPAAAPGDVMGTLQCSATPDAVKDVPSTNTPNLLLYAPPGGFPGGGCVDGGGGAGPGAAGSGQGGKQPPAEASSAGRRAGPHGPGGHVALAVASLAAGAALGGGVGVGGGFGGGRLWLSTVQVGEGGGAAAA